MNTFENINFLGTFRPYQQRVLDTSAKYLQNNKIHIVAAPGSGKTILGLELIRRLNSYCLVLSPTNTIRYQWGDRFESMFLTKDKKTQDYVSFDLNNIKPITSITYQALHSAMDKVSFIDEDNVLIDYSHIDILQTINQYDIKTICVDEAHHLQNKWQKALEKFIKMLNKDIKIIALTATPPYDATPIEWQRYINICGEIDEEIFVSELVQCKNLCPHQDYIYLNYPTKQEGLIFNKFKQSIVNVFNELKTEQYMLKLPEKLFKRIKKQQLEKTADYLYVFSLLKKLEIPFDEKFVKRFYSIPKLPQSLKTYENALNIIRQTYLLSPDDHRIFSNKLKDAGLIEYSRVNFFTNPKKEKQLLNSFGKMESIIDIIDCETKALKQDLRMLILTDFIRKKDSDKIGANSLFRDLSIVSIFENVRRHFLTDNLAVLSGGIVILPTQLENDVRTLLQDKSNKLTCKPLKNTNYSEYIFRLSNKEKVKVVGQLFEEGKVNIIIGTKSLLGEGWDSPCINTLILASFVGSFMLSNQMRGRAIRVFNKNPNKTANIWHLVTLEPENKELDKILDCNEETSSDYKTLKRRFSCFVGPNYNNNDIESGIDRITILKDSYTKQTVDEVNKQMINFAKDRQNLANKWQVVGRDAIMQMQCSIPKSRIPKKPAIISLIKTNFYAITILFLTIVLPLLVQNPILIWMGYIASTLLFIIFAFKLYKTINLMSSTLFIKKLTKQLKEVFEDKKMFSSASNISVSKQQKNILVSISLYSIKEQTMFLTALQEMFSPLNNPRYILCFTNGFKLKHPYCFQLPSVFATNIKTANYLKFNLTIIRPSKLMYANGKKLQKDVMLCTIKQYLKNNQDEIVIKQILQTEK